MNKYRKGIAMVIPIIIVLVCLIANFFKDEKFRNNATSISMNNPFIYMGFMALILTSIIGLFNGYVRSKLGTHEPEDVALTTLFCYYTFFIGLATPLVTNLLWGNLLLGYAFVIFSVLLLMAAFMMPRLSILFHGQGNAYAKSIHEKAHESPPALTPGKKTVGAKKNYSFLILVGLFIILIILIAQLNSIFPSTNPDGMNGTRVNNEVNQKRVADPQNCKDSQNETETSKEEAVDNSKPNNGVKITKQPSKKKSIDDAQKNNEGDAEVAHTPTNGSWDPRH